AGESVDAGLARSARWTGAEPIASEPHPDGHPPPDALLRLRRNGGAVRDRDRSASRRPARRSLDRLLAPMDLDSLDLPFGWDHPRLLVGVRGARLGRLLGVGSG